MRNSVPALTALAAALLLSGCQSTSSRSRADAGPGVTVTRLHLGQPIARGEIRVEPAAPLAAGSPAAVHFPHLSGVVERELARLGWTVASGNTRSEQVAAVRVGPTASGPGTELNLRIQRRSDATVLWEGRANTRETDLGPAINQLVEAVFRDFPGESGRTIRIR
jgi:hypothetical protein